MMLFCKNRLKEWSASAIGFAMRPAPVGETRTGRYPNFDLLRLFLALEVVVAHAGAYIDPNFDWAGYVIAVPAFLAISGFLVLQSYSESGSWGAFLKKRALRILPALTVSLLICAPLFGWSAVYNSLLNWATGGLYHLPSMANTPLWSLAWEELAYLLLACLWVLGAYKRPFFIWVLLAISVCVVWAGSNLEPRTRMILFLGPAFFAGNLMYLYRANLLGFHRFLPWFLFYIMLQWRFVPDRHMFGESSLILMQAFAVVWAGMAGVKIIPFKFPDISYGIYVYHFPIVAYLALECGITSPLKMGVLLTAILIPFSLASWYLIEKPALRFKPQHHE